MKILLAQYDDVKRTITVGAGRGSTTIAVADGMDIEMALLSIAERFSSKFDVLVSASSASELDASRVPPPDWKWLIAGKVREARFGQDRLTAERFDPDGMALRISALTPSVRGELVRSSVGRVDFPYFSRVLYSMRHACVSQEACSVKKQKVAEIIF